mmetsp:Transcript_12537/g.18944  ORF Transcript_12537/g.18944 Transcript_12537/m.18944 type:complete len:275 (+) Transcript_12537:46-870(+)
MSASSSSNSSVDPKTLQANSTNIPKRRKKKFKQRPGGSPVVVEHPSSMEASNVHQVYDSIASHFSATRYKPWPLVSNFLKQNKDVIGKGAWIADIGCGNGKYLGENPSDTVMVGGDYCANLVKIVADRGHQGFVIDSLALPFRDQCFDAAICVAVIHHMSSEQRRRKAIEELLRIIKVGGLCLITVWAFEQNGRKFEKQDTLVPWHLHVKHQNDQDKEKIEKLPKDQNGRTIFERFYHVFKKGELDALCEATGQCEIVSSVWDVDNWNIVIKKI